MKASLNLNFGNDVYLIEDGKVPKNLQNTEAWYNLLAPLSASVSEVQFTWLSHPLELGYQMSVWSSDPEVATVQVNKPLTGETPRYEEVFAINFPCTGKKGGVIDIGYSLNFTTGSPKFLDGKLELKVRRQCYKKGAGSTYPVENNTSSNSKVQRNTIIAVAAAVTVLLCFSLCIGLYYRYYKKNKRLQMKFDTEYELAAKREMREVKDQHDLLNHVYEEEDDAPPRPIFNPKKKPPKAKKVE